jgi:hypothetical protein
MDCDAADAAAGLAAVAAGWDRRRAAYLRARVLADGPEKSPRRLIEGLAADARRTLPPETSRALPPWATVARTELGIVALNVAALLALGQRQWEEAEVLAGEVVARDHHDLFAQRVVDAAHERSPEIESAADRWLAGRVCPAPFEQIETRTDGAVHFCCSGWQPVPIGRLSDGADAMWNSARAQEIRRSVLDGDFEHCSRWHCPAIAARRLPGRAEAAGNAGPLAKAVREHATRLDTAPTRVILSHDRSCNISCPSCRDHLIQLGHARSAALDALFEKSLRPLLTHARWIKLTGSGDPFGSRHFRGLLRTVATEPGERRLQLHTNGLLFDERAWDELALEERVDSVWISIDAARPATYSVLRRGGNFRVLLRNLDFLGALRRHGAFNSLRLDFVVQAGNYREIGDFVDLARRVGADGVYFIRLRNWGHIPVARFREMDVCDARHPEHARLLEQLADPRLAGPTVDLGSLASLLPSNGSRTAGVLPTLHAG